MRAPLCSDAVLIAWGQQGLSITEIAERAGISVESASGRLVKARRRVAYVHPRAGARLIYRARTITLEDAGEYLLTFVRASETPIAIAAAIADFADVMEIPSAVHAALVLLGEHWSDVDKLVTRYVERYAVNAQAGEDVRRFVLQARHRRWTAYELRRLPHDNTR